MSKESHRECVDVEVLCFTRRVDHENLLPASCFLLPASCFLLPASCCLAAVLSLTAAAHAEVPRFLVDHVPGAAQDHSAAILLKFGAARKVNGIVEFEAGKLYRTKQIDLLSTQSVANQTMPAGIEGNGAILKWTEGSAPPGSSSLMFLKSPQHRGNSGFFIRNLTLDCGNNAILNLTANGQLKAADDACNYGLRVQGMEDTLIENVGVFRAKQAGVFLVGSGSEQIRNCALRNVTVRYGAARGFQIWTGGSSTSKVENLVLENCYAQRNLSDGYYVELASIRLVGCGAEKNKGWNMYFRKDCPSVEIIGGYTEKGYFNHLTNDWVNPVTDEDRWNIKVEEKVGPPVTGPDLRIIGGRMVGQYNYKALSNVFVHSLGHAAQGFDVSNTTLPVVGMVSDYSANYVNPQVVAKSSAYDPVDPDFSFYKGIKIGAVTCTDRTTWQTQLKAQKNVSMVLYDSAATDQASDIVTQVAAAKASGTGYSGTVAFEPGRTYLVGSQIDIVGGSHGAGLAVGVEGNGATLKGTGSGGTLLLNLSRVNFSDDAQNDRLGFFVRNLKMNANLKFDVGLAIEESKFFHLRDIHVCGAQEIGVQCRGTVVAGTDKGLYYGTFDRVFSQRNGSESQSADGFDLYADNDEGVRLANVGYYDCGADFNTGRGLNLWKASVIWNRCTFRGNLGYGIEAGKSRSLDVVDSHVVSGTSGPAIHLMKYPEDTNTGYIGGFHLLGGQVRSQSNRQLEPGTIDYDPHYVTPPGIAWGLYQSMIHVSEHSVIPEESPPTVRANQNAVNAPGPAEGT